MPLLRDLFAMSAQFLVKLNKTERVLVSSCTHHTPTNHVAPQNTQKFQDKSEQWNQHSDGRTESTS